MNKQLKAVTVIELAIALLISAIVIGIAYNSMDVFERLYHRFQANNDRNYQLVVFNKIMKSDLDKADVIYKSGSGILLKINDEDWIKYEWYSDFVLRNKVQSGLDTFYLQSSVIQLYFNGQEQNIDNQVIDQIDIEITRKEEILNAIFAKKYGADIYINYAENILN
jgi:hypothetical protein